MPEYFKIGKIVAAFRLEGEMILLHNLGKKTELKGIEAVYIEQQKESFLPFFVQSSRIKSNEEIYVKLEDISTREAALRMLNKEIWMEENDFKKLAARSAPITLLGYHIVDNNNNLGEVAEVFEQPHQILCKILLKEKEILIPLHEQTLKKIDHKNRKIMVQLPDGLLDLYLNK